MGLLGNGKTTLVRSITGCRHPLRSFIGKSQNIQGSYSVQKCSTLSQEWLLRFLSSKILILCRNIQSSFLNTLDGARVRAGLFIIGTTNYPEKIDPALINRAGRFDSTYEIPSPSSEVRRSYMKRSRQKGPAR